MRLDDAYKTLESYIAQGRSAAISVPQLDSALAGLPINELRLLKSRLESYCEKKREKAKNSVLEWCETARADAMFGRSSSSMSDFYDNEVAAVHSEQVRTEGLAKQILNHLDSAIKRMSSDAA